MAGHQDRLLPNAGSLLVAAGFVAAFTGGLYGLDATRPGLVVLSVLLLMGYSIVGYLLVQKGAAYYRQVMPIASVLVLLTLLIFREGFGTFVDESFAYFFLYPGLALLLSYAGGALVTHAIELATPRIPWPGRTTSSLNTVLHLAAAAPIWSAFSFTYLLGGADVPLMRFAILAGSVGVAILCVVAGHASVRKGHPGITVVGSALAFLACVFYLFQFMLGFGDRDVRGFGQFVALLGLLLTAFPAAVASVAWIQTANPSTTSADDGEPAQ